MNVDIQEMNKKNFSQPHNNYKKIYNESFLPIFIYRWFLGEERLTMTSKITFLHYCNTLSAKFVKKNIFYVQ